MKESTQIFSMIFMGKQVDLLLCIFYLASPGLYIPHASSVGLEGDHSGKVHIFTEEL